MAEDKKTADVYARIYGSCQDSLLFRTMLAVVKQALSYAQERGHVEHSFICDNERWGGLNRVKQFGLHSELLHDIQRLGEVLNEDYAAQFGPRLSVKGPADASMECPHILTFGFDDDLDLYCRFSLSPDFEWRDSGLARAAIAYQRTAHWDFAPGEAGIWICYYLITDGWGSGKNDWRYNGNIAGFVILYDRDKDGQYESLAHVWTAAAARRRGVANTLIAHAREHFPIKKVEGPLTDDGAALFKAVWPEIVQTP